MVRAPVCRAPLLLRHDRQHAQRAAGAVDDLERRRNQDRALRRQLVELAQAGETVTVGLGHEGVGRERRTHAARRTGIGADGFRTPADHAFGNEIVDGLYRRTGRVRALVVGVEEFRFAGVALVPVGAHQHPTTGRNVAMRLLPGFDAIDGEKEIRVLRGFGRAVDDTNRRDEILHRDRIGRTILIVAAADPVDRRIEMRARVLAELEPVPLPERAILVVVRDRMNLDRRRVLADLRRQLDQRRFGPERSGQIHHLDGAGCERRYEIAETLGTGHWVSPSRSWNSNRRIRYLEFQSWNSILEVQSLGFVASGATSRKPSAIILDMKYLRWQAGATIRLRPASAHFRASGTIFGWAR